jgi:pimeloyl-ACP methyl ester carboxylesterase
MGLRITVIGHSMGAIVADEIMINFPDLPYQNIVFMAAAGSIREFKTMTEPVLRTPRCGDLRFYNLSLHPEAEARDLEVSGAAPVGSLLEWIDDIFETPVTPTDRTLGKWQNVVYAENEFDSIAARRIFFHRFGLRAPDPLMHGQFVLSESERTPGVCPSKSKSYWDPAFWSEVYSVEDGLCTSRRLYEIGHARYGEPSEYSAQ